MNIDLSDDAKEYGRQALRAFDAAGGDQLLQQAEAKPDTREALVAPVLEGLGAWELDPRTDTDDLEAAAALCRSAGYWALPYPVAERLAGLDTAWFAATVDGPCRRVARPGAAGPAFTALGLALPCWTLLGMLDRAIDLTIAHVSLRKQFGQTLSSFQGVQFQLTDAEVERGGVDMLAKYTLWSMTTSDGDTAINDALALRLAALEAAEVVFRVCHQLHGAVGFCDETTLSWLSRYSQPLRRLPFGLSQTRDILTTRLGRRGLTGLFS